MVCANSGWRRPHRLRRDGADRHAGPDDHKRAGHSAVVRDHGDHNPEISVDAGDCLCGCEERGWRLERHRQSLRQPDLHASLQGQRHWRQGC
ncbi:hypothetical protein ACFPRL_08840 [Pseudoclavibacter helvolus]